MCEAVANASEFGLAGTQTDGCLCFRLMFDGVSPMQRDSTTGRSLRGFAPREVCVNVYVDTHLLLLERVMVDQPWLSSQVADKPFELFIAPLVRDCKLPTLLFRAVRYVSAILSKIVAARRQCSKSCGLL